MSETFSELLRTATVHSLVESRARERPDHPAVTDARTSLSYRDLDALAARVARRLRREGVGRGDRVGVYLDRSAELVAGVLGVLKTGAAYVPLDPEFPRERLELMVEDGEVRVVLTQEALLGPDTPGAARVTLEEVLAAAPAEADDPLPEVSPHDLAYVIYTSGSTGRPKGVQITHRSVVNLLSSMAVEPGISPEDVWLAVTTLSFDISVLELFGPLLAGATTAVASREEVLDGSRLAEALRRSGATIMQATPIAWRVLIEAGWGGDGGLKALCGGEALPQELAAELLPRTASLWNMYGPTETTIWSTCYRVKDAGAPVLIGRPVANTAVYVLDKRMRPLPPGVPGEIFIGGAGVAAGYHRRDELNRERFLPDPFSPTPGARVYRTGDMGRYLRDGNLEYRSRADNQVKIRGFRVELGEIETALAAVEGVRQAVVGVLSHGAGDDRLVAFLLGDGGPPAAEALRARLAERLPQYMIPHHFVEVDAYPTTPNGKVDRKALLAGLGELPRAEAAYVAPRTPVETAVAEVLAEVLELERAGADANFFDLGGHSVLAMRVVARLREELAPQLSLRDLFRAPTVAGLAARIEEIGGAVAPLPLAADREEVVL